MRLDKDTQVCISISAHPSNFGTRVHNAGYEALGLNFLYKAFAVTDVAGVIAGVRALGIRGLSVSMPHKETVIAHLDDLHESARRIGAVNTVVNEGGKLVGYNTDAFGARAALQLLGDLSASQVLVLGAGGAAKAVLFALRALDAGDVVICNRSETKAALLARAWSCRSIPWEAREGAKADVVVNATALGMAPNPDEVAVRPEALRSAWGVMDVVTNPMESRLIREARELGKKAVPGYTMSLHQAAAQFELYTGVKPPLEVFEGTVRKMLEPS